MLHKDGFQDGPRHSKDTLLIRPSKQKVVCTQRHTVSRHFTRVTRDEVKVYAADSARSKAPPEGSDL